MVWLNDNLDSIDELRRGAKLSSCNERSTVRISARTVTAEERAGVIQKQARRALHLGDAEKIAIAEKKLKQMRKDVVVHSARLDELRLQKVANDELSNKGVGAVGEVEVEGAGAP
jgi:hypothetical protein